MRSDKDIKDTSVEEGSPYLRVNNELLKDIRFLLAMLVDKKYVLDKELAIEKTEDGFTVKESIPIAEQLRPGEVYEITDKKYDGTKNTD